MTETYGDCIFCGGDIEERVVDVDYRSEGRLFVIERVPSGVCSQCGEQFYTAKIAKQMEAAAKSPSDTRRVIEVPLLSLA